MITFETERGFDISQASYDERLEKLPLQKLRCSCGRTGSLVYYGSYVRRIKVGGREAPLAIRRLKCKACGRTHAVLPSCIVPYSRVTVWEQVEILVGVQSGQGCSAVMERNFSIGESLSSSINTIRLYEEGLRIMRVDRLCELLEALGLGVLDCFSIKLGEGVSVSPETLHLAQRLEAVNSAVYPKLVRQMHAPIDVVES